MKRAYAPFLSLVALSVLALLVAETGATVPAGAEGSPPIVAGDTAWMLTAAGLVLLMTPGLSFFYGGMVGYKNIVSTMLQSFVSLGVISLLWVLVGFSLCFGEDVGGLGIIGNPMTFFMMRDVGVGAGVLGSESQTVMTIPLMVFAMFQLKFAIITPALITGAFAERVRFAGYLLFITLFSLIIYCPLAHMTWHPDGLFFNWGVLDFAGGTVVHMSAGFAALAGAMFLGRRHCHVAKEAHQPANIPYVMLGTGMLWFGWFGFNAGSALAANGTAAMAFATTNTATAAAMLGWIFFDWFLGKKPSALGACIGAVVGLVAITPAAGFVTVPQSIVIGLVASVVSNLAVQYRTTKSEIDDTLDVFPCHGLGGMTGMLMTGIFAADVGLWYGATTTFLYHLLALGIVTIFAFGGSLGLYFLTNLIIPMRVTDEQEVEGLDLSQHGEQAWAGVEVLAVTRVNGHGTHTNGRATHAEPMTAGL